MAVLRGRAILKVQVNLKSGPRPKLLRIGEIAERAGLATSAVRYYESAGLLRHPDRVNGRRRYDETVLEELAVIRLAQLAGFTVAEIRTLMHGFARPTPPSERWRKLANAKLAEVDRKLADLEHMRIVLRSLLRCECPTLEDCARVLPPRAASGPG